MRCSSIQKRTTSRSNFTSSETALDAISADSGGKFFFREFSVRVLNTSKKWLRSSIREKSMFAPPFSCDSITDRRRGQERNLVRKEVPPSEEDHRSPENNFYLIAEFWYTTSVRSVLPLGAMCKLEPEDVAAMVTLLKIVRASGNPEHIDNGMDGAGCLACGGEVSTH